LRANTYVHSKLSYVHHDGSIARMQVAVKTLKAINTAGESRAQAMRREANVVITLGVHEHIVLLQGVVESHNALVFPLYKKGSVEDAFRRGERLSPTQKLLIAKGASAGLHYMHAKRAMLHRDIAARYRRTRAQTHIHACHKTHAHTPFTHLAAGTFSLTTISTASSATLA
jgi:hypothetical protein